MYAIVHTRPNIAFALRKLSQYITDPSEAYWTYLKAIMRYVRLLLDLQIRFGPSDEVGLVVYTDAD
jgi:hypothetical protein